MTQINAYIGFNGKCSEAMNFYKECLGGELFFNVIRESPMASQFPENMQDKILHSSLTKNALVLIATQSVGPEGYTKGNNIALSLNCSSEEEINTLFSKLSKDGKIVDGLKPQFWGAIFGVLTDKFGITWMLNFDKNQQ